MTLIDNLKAIESCKNAIKDALARKGYDDMNTTPFSDYAGKIDALQLESGDTPSTPSADYIYSNAYLLGSDPITIVDNIPHGISLDENGKFIIDVICPVEIKGSASKNIYDTIFTIDVPSTYNLSVEYYDQGTTTYYPQEMKSNPRHDTINRNGVVYKSYVRAVEDEKDQGSAYISSEPLQYRITILK
jgi:hypothetical protein